MKAFGLYAASCVVLVALLGAVAWVLAGVDGRQVVLVSAGLALVVQMAAFGIARAMQAQSLMVGWGLGSLLRLVVLVAYALLVARLWRAPLAPALLSFVAFLFVTTVVEPIFLRYR